MYFWDSVGDFFNTSGNEAKRDQYKKLVKYLNKKIPILEKDYKYLENGCKIEYEIMKGVEKTDASGELAFMYDTKLDVLKTEIDNLLIYYNNILTSFKNKLAMAQSKYEYYVEQCRIEDEQRRQRIREEQEREEREARERREAKAASKS